MLIFVQPLATVGLAACGETSSASAMVVAIPSNDL
jgi:hypothetical protein